MKTIGRTCRISGQAAVAIEATCAPRRIRDEEQTAAWMLTSITLEMRRTQYSRNSQLFRTQKRQQICGGRARGTCPQSGLRDDLEQVRYRGIQSNARTGNYSHRVRDPVAKRVVRIQRQLAGVVIPVGGHVISSKNRIFPRSLSDPGKGANRRHKSAFHFEHNGNRPSVISWLEYFALQFPSRSS